MSKPALEPTLFDEERATYCILCAVQKFKNESHAYKFQIEDRIGSDIDPELFHTICAKGYLSRIGSCYYLTEEGKKCIINLEWKYNS